MLLEQSAGAQTVAVYCRVSSEEQAQSGTIQNQGEFAKRYCDLHELKILEVYTDEGVSGVISPFERPSSTRMLADAGDHRAYPSPLVCLPPICPQRCPQPARLMPNKGER